MVEGCGELLLIGIVLLTVEFVFRSENAGISLYGSFVGGAAHADDIRTIAQSTTVLTQQAIFIDHFTKKNLLHLNKSNTADA
jgi:hypothetical protein